ncbi:MAG: NAD-dependent epimerase/dehydratase family protein [Bacteroidota bacterium]|nr:NAD-dependent epimerase/dehydratase family protein [Bacteroidota bacterium]
MQTILGSGGAIGTPLAKELLPYTNNIRLVARNPKKVNENDELFPAGLTNKEEVYKAVEGSEVVYLTVGLQYNLKIWQRDWPLIMHNVIDACKEHHAKLVFLDNVYLYAAGEMQNMTENSLIDPPSKKGKVRAVLVKMIFDEIKTGGLKALIARSADFYGPNVKSSPLTISVLENFQKNKKAFWQSDATKIHSFTFTQDAATATAFLGNTEDAYDQTWHLPSSSEKLTGRDFIEKIAAEMNVKPRYYILSKTLISILGIFMPLVKELWGMQYQNDRNYFFNSDKFDQRFHFTATSYNAGISKMVKAGSENNLSNV